VGFGVKSATGEAIPMQKVAEKSRRGREDEEKRSGSCTISVEILT